MFGLGIFNADGVCCYGTNTNLEELEPSEISGEGEVTFTIDHLDLVEGTYRLDLAAHKTRRLPVRLPSPALHIPHQVAHARCRDLSSRSQVVLCWEHQVQGGLEGLRA